MVNGRIRSPINHEPLAIPHSSPDDFKQFLRLLFQHLLGLGLDVQPEERLGLARADIEPPVIELDCQPIQLELTSVLLALLQFLELSHCIACSPGS